MEDFPFQAYISQGRAYFEYGEGAHKTKADEPFPQCLLDFLYLDIPALDALSDAMHRALQDYYQSHDEKQKTAILSALDEMAQMHIFFSLLPMQWRARFARCEGENYKDVQDVLPRITTDVQELQRCILALFEHVLDIDGADAPVQERLTNYYKVYGGNSLGTYHFLPCTLRFEMVDEDTFAEVFYPADIYDLINFFVRECVKQEIKMRRCKNCGKYFTFTGRSSAEYCNRPVDNKGRTCRDVGAANVWTKSKGADLGFKEYRREYKRRFAWIKSGKLTPEDFYAWSKKARQVKGYYDNGEITSEGFREWLKDS